MNNKAEQFNAFLEDQKIRVFQMEELEGGTNNILLCSGLSSEWKDSSFRP